MFKRLTRLLKGRPRDQKGPSDASLGPKIEALEKRVLFSADLPWITPDSIDSAVFGQVVTNTPNHPAGLAVDTELVERQPILIVDRSYVDHEDHTDGDFVRRYRDQGVDTFVLDADSDGILAVSDLLKKQPLACSLNLATTASPDGVLLGGETLSMSTVLNRANDIAEWRQQLGNDPEVNILARDIRLITDLPSYAELLSDVLRADVRCVAADDLPPDTSGGLVVGNDVGALQAGNEAFELSPGVEIGELRQEIVFVDRRVDGYQTLIADIKSNAGQGRTFEVVLLDADADGVEQVNALLGDREEVDAIHLISHSADGGVQFGNTWLTDDNIADYDSQIAQWRSALNEDADLLIYGCNFAASTGGQQLLGTLQQLTGADVAASTDNTGHRLLDGDWQLEYTAGVIDTEIAISEAMRANWVSYLTVDDLFVTSTSSGGLTINSDGGNDTYLRVDDSSGSVLGGATALTVEMQVGFTDTSHDQQLVSYMSTNGTDGLRLSVQTSGDLLITVEGQSALSSAFDYHSLADGARHTISVSWDSGAGAWAAYVDGQLVDSGSGLATGSSLGTGGTLTIGADQDTVGGGFSATEYFEGTLFAVRVFDDVRTSTEVGISYNADVPRDEGGLKANWRFNQLSTDGHIVNEVSGEKLTLSHASGLTASNPQVNLTVVENAASGTLVGTVYGVDPQREARIASLLAGDPNLHYSAETGKFYKVNTTTNDAATAVTAAGATTLNGVGGQLANIRSAEEQALVFGMVQPFGGLAYLGGSDVDVEGEWRWLKNGVEQGQFWSGGQAGFAPNSAYENWLPGEPQGGGGENHLGIRASDGIWLDLSGAGTYRSVVEWNADEVLDASHALTYAIQSQTVAGAFAIDSSSGEIRVLDGSLLDYEAQTMHTLNVRTTDVDSNTYDQALTVSLSNLAETSDAPTDLSNGIELNTDGGNDAYFLANDGSAILGGLTALTLESTFQIEDQNNEPGIFSYYVGADEIRLRFDAADHLRFKINNVNVTTTNAYSELLDGDTHHVAVSWDSTNGDVSFYINGQFVERVTGLAVGHTIAAGGELAIGNDQDGLETGYKIGQTFHGTFHDVRVWNEVRNEADISLNYQHKLDLTPAEASAIGLVANWQMKGFDGSGEVVDIVSGNNLSVRHATGTGFVASTPDDDLHTNENAVAGSTVGFVVPSDPDLSNDIVNDGLFLDGDSGTWQSYFNGQSFGGWTVVGGVGVDHTSQFPSPLGGVGIDLERGVGDEGGVIGQTLTTEVGREYQVIFAARGNFGGDPAAKHLRVSAGGVSQDFVIEDTGVYEQHSMTFTASSTSTDLFLQGLRNTGYGAVVSDVQVVEIPAAISTILNGDPSLSYDAGTGKLYRFVNSPTNFDTASAAATGSDLNGVSGQLITIDSDYENELVRQLVLDSGNQIWIGAEDDNLDGNWNWLKGGEVGRQFWTGGDSGTTVNGEYASRMFLSEQAGEVRLRMLSDGNWGDNNKFQNYAYVVEWDASQVLSNYTFSLTDPSGNFEIDSSTGEITVAATSALDYEAATSHDVDVTVTDASGTSYTETMTITVTDDVDAPSNTVPPPQSTNEDTSLVFNGANAISVNDGITADSRVQVTLDVANGVLTLAALTGIDFVAGGDGTATMVIEGFESDINTALDGLIFTPDANYNGSDTLNITTAIAADLVGNYTFGPGTVSGTTVSDQSAGTSQDGILNGNPAVSNDPDRGDVLSLDGAGDYVNIAGMFDEPANVSLAAWVNFSSAASQAGEVISIGNMVALRVNDPAHGVTGFFYDGSAFQFIATGTETNLADDQWHHVVLSFDDVNNEQGLYIDGQLVASATHTDSISYENWSPQTTIGSHADTMNSDYDFNGLIDDARVYDRALSADEIAALFADCPAASDSVAITIAAVNDAPGGTVTIDNTTPSQGDTLTASNTLTDVDGLSGPIAYQWQRDGADIVGATGGTYATTQADVGSVMTVVASYTDDQGTAESVTSADTAAVSNVNDAPGGSVVIDNTTPAQGDTLTASNTLTDADGLSGPISYQWQRDGIDIAGATNSGYTTSQSDVGAVITVVASYTDDEGTDESVTSAGTATVTNVNDAPGGSVVIDNTTPAQGDTLTASNTLTDADGLSGPISYQWQRDGSDIAGATGTTYTTGQDDVDAVLTVVASYTDDEGTDESVSSAGTAAVSNVNDAPGGSVSIDNTTPAQGDTLTASNNLTDADGLSGPISYQWRRDGSDIAGATGTTYTTGQDDVGAVLTVVASYTDDEGTDESVSSAGTAAVSNVNDAPGGNVVIDNTTPAQGDTLTASNTLTDADGLSGPISYQWQRDGADIAGATGATYTTGQNDVGAVLTVVASYTDDEGTDESVSSAGTAAVSNVNDAPGGSVVIDNTAPAQGETLTASNTLTDADGLSGPISYQWQRDGSDIAGAVGSSYTTTQADVGAVITVVASYTDDEGTDESVTSAGTAAVSNVNDAPGGAVTIDNTMPAQGDTLTASNTLTDADGLSGPISYQWQRDGSDIGGATGSTYTTSQNDVGAVLTVVASYTDDEGTDESVTSAGTAAVSNVNDAPGGSVVIDNTTPAQGDTLTASNTLTDADGLSGPVSYQWQRNGADIVGATGTTYTTSHNDVGAVVSVIASYTDDQGTAESVTSADTAAVSNVNDAPGGAVTIDNMTPTDGDLLTVSNTLTDIDGLSGPISYQWQRDGLAIAGATGSTYFTTQADVGAVISVVASYTDDQGTAESVSSSPTAAVVDVNQAPGGSVTIDNMMPLQGDTLTVANTLTDADGLSGPISYQWQRDGADVVGATSGTYTTTQDDVGSRISVVATYTDDAGSTEQVSSSATAPVINVNDAPLAVDDTMSAQEDNSLIIDFVRDLAANDVDIDGDQLTLVRVSTPLNGTLVDNGDGSWTYTPAANYNGTETLTYEVADAAGATAIGQLSIVVDPVNDLPTWTMGPTLSVDEGFVGAVPVSATDVDGDSLSYSISGGSDEAVFRIASNNGELSFAAAPNYESPGDADTDNLYEIIVTVEDSAGARQDLPLQIQIVDVNEAPLAEDSLFRLLSGANSLLVGQIPATDPDAGDSLTFDVVGGSGQGVFSVDSETGDIASLGALVPTGIYDLSVSITDANGTSVTVTVSIIVETDVDSSVGGSGPLTPTSGSGPEASEPSADGDEDVLAGSMPAQPIGSVDSFTLRTTTSSVGQDVRIGIPETRHSTIDGEVGTRIPLRLVAAQSAEILNLFGNVELDLDLPEIVTITVPPELLVALDQVTDKSGLPVSLNLQSAGVAVASISLSAGFIVWILRAGSLLASLLATKPVWTDIDPLPIFSNDDDGDRYDS